jgi:hypothetical protein
MAGLNDLDENQLIELKNVFNTSMQTCFEIFGVDCFRKRYNANDYRKPISKAVFDTLSVNIAWLDDEQRDVLEENAGEFRYGMIELFNEGEFNQAISNSTGQKARVKLRFEKVRNLIDEIILND